MNSTEKIACLLKRLASYPYSFSLEELAETMQCGKSGAYKILSVLVQHNLVYKKNNKKYTLGTTIGLLGKKYRENIVEWKHCIPYMEELNKLTGETVTLGIRENHQAIVAYRVISKERVRIDGDIGIILPYNVTSIGKMLGAYDDFEIIKEKAKNEPMIKRTPNSIYNLEDLEKEYEKIKKQGYVESLEENNIGVISVGAPLKDIDGNVWGCIAIGTPKARYDDEIFKKHTDLVISTAKKISEKIPYYDTD